MERWEYKTLRAKDLRANLFSSRKTAASMDEVFNDLGRQGWEVVQLNFDNLSASTGIAALMKRRRS